MGGEERESARERERDREQESEREEGRKDGRGLGNRDLCSFAYSPPPKAPTATAPSLRPESWFTDFVTLAKFFFITLLQNSQPGRLSGARERERCGATHYRNLTIFVRDF